MERKPDIFAGLEKERGDDDKLVREYELVIPALGDQLRETNQRMRAMREAGIPDTAAYEKLRKQVLEQHQKASELQRRIVELAERMPAAREVHESLRSDIDRIEDFFQLIMGEHDAWLKEHASSAESMGYGRRETDFGEFRERSVPLEQYDEEVMKLQEMVAALESQTDFFVKKGKLPQIADDILRQIDDVHEHLQELDEKTPNAVTSRERRSLVGMMDALRSRIARERAKGTPPAVAAARAKYGFVKDSYASVAHLLTEPQRREMRSYLARLTGLVNDLETHHAITGTIARAATVAPEISEAVLKPRP